MVCLESAVHMADNSLDLTSAARSAPTSWKTHSDCWIKSIQIHSYNNSISETMNEIAPPHYGGTTLVTATRVVSQTGGTRADRIHPSARLPLLVGLCLDVASEQRGASSPSPMNDTIWATCMGLASANSAAIAASGETSQAWPKRTAALC